MKIADFIGGAAGVALGCYVIFESRNMPEDHIMKIGPGYFPELLAMGLIVFSCILLVYAFLGKSKGVAEPIRFRDRGVRRALISLLAIIAYTALFKTLGFPLCTMLLVGGVMALLGKRDPKILIGISLAVTAGVWLVFTKLLTLSLPMGVLSDFF